MRKIIVALAVALMIVCGVVAYGLKTAEVTRTVTVYHAPVSESGEIKLEEIEVEEIQIEEIQIEETKIY